uniref:glycosyltransferase family 2 protein n=1 Tax=uncultured Helicobacter sp. TaxID=175537 RepID=UPI0037502112
MRIGLIVPVYNVEKYLAKCLDSILAQSYQDFVIVLVNDASTDCSRDICFTYYGLDKRIVVLDSVANAGQASVRNAALKFFTHKGAINTLFLPNITIYTHFESIPQCQYIKFVDSDDSITKECLEICLKSIQTYQVDVLIHDWYCINESGQIRNQMFFKKFLALEDAHCYTPMEVATFFAKRKRGVAG